jgi:predicted phosphodiesterase
MDYYTFEFGGKQVVCLHGHQVDKNPYLKNFKRLPKFNAWIISKVDGLFGIDIRRWLVSLSDSVNNGPYRQLLMDFESSVLDIFKSYDIVVCGHTHFPVIKRIGSIIYCNCGDSIQHSTLIKLDKSSIYLIDYKDNNIKDFYTVGFDND